MALESLITPSGTPDIVEADMVVEFPTYVAPVLARIAELSRNPTSEDQSDLLATYLQGGYALAYAPSNPQRMEAIMLAADLLAADPHGRRELFIGAGIFNVALDHEELREYSGIHDDIQLTEGRRRLVKLAKQRARTLEYSFQRRSQTNTLQGQERYSMFAVNTVKQAVRRYGHDRYKRDTRCELAGRMLGQVPEDVGLPGIKAACDLLNLDPMSRLALLRGISESRVAAARPDMQVVNGEPVNPVQASEYWDLVIDQTVALENEYRSGQW